MSNEKNVPVLGRERQMVDASVGLIEASGFKAVGVTRDEEALSELDSGRFIAVLVGGGVEPESRTPLREHAAPHGTVVIEARRDPAQTVQEHVRHVILPRLQEIA